MAKLITLEVPPPGAGLDTITVAVPSLAMAAAGTAAVKRVELTKLVATAVPPKLTTEEDIKFVPETVRVNAAPPANVLAGEMVMIAGKGLSLLTVEALPPPQPARKTRLIPPSTISSLIVRPLMTPLSREEGRTIANHTARCIAIIFLSAILGPSLG